MATGHVAHLQMEKPELGKVKGTGLSLSLYDSVGLGQRVRLACCGRTMELEVERAASRPALTVRVGRVKLSPMSDQLRAPTGARAPGQHAKRVGSRH